ncbi:NAD(P)-dependent dehydrogenase (short-subunit alcohol dehydrogenase family) [Stackebrandtia endophytica]|uniref:NAD(P)-dependent dehydrogenase (Short-subunit alcohol dehydrogenase family) n=1 Tax=Stackebrandtia endophytica TaxID=1496996 RepID=A0A543ATM6_9ACTN|nr:SDR family oxidoreductase [Stackebrandtia endophytica]TQL75947.1 NAD(P)-dependent dehydrogenase (short-subunit alcohol dehydrogenase family) [Stackebrandtia endophytica]
MLQGKIAFITGGSRGIGAAVAIRLASDGADIALTYHSDRQAAEKVADAITALGRKADIQQIDVADAERLRAAVDDAANRLGGLDILVNNAGIAPMGPFTDATVTEIDRILAVHPRATMIASQAAATHLATGGRIINIGSSLARTVPYPGVAMYAMSKSALIGLTKGMAQDLAPRDITVNLVHPGSTDTDMNPADGPDADAERAVAALRRYCTPEDIAATVAHLAGPYGRNITGTEFAVDAGFGG